MKTTLLALVALLPVALFADPTARLEYPFLVISDETIKTQTNAIRSSQPEYVAIRADVVTSVIVRSDTTRAVVLTTSELALHVYDQNREIANRTYTIQFSSVRSAENFAQQLLSLLAEADDIRISRTVLSNPLPQ